MYRVLKLKESESKEFRYITTHGIGPGTVPEGVFVRSEDLDNGKTAIYLNRPLSDEELKKYDIKPEWIQEDKALTEDEDEAEELEDIENAEETEEELEDTVDTEEDQEENPVEEESLVDKELDEIRDILIDLDNIRLYKLMNNEEEFYIVGRLDKDSNQVEMLVDTKPADTINVDIAPDGTETEVKTVEKEPDEEIATRFEFVKLPTKFEQVKEMFPRYGEELEPDHEAIIEYLMNLLIEQNPKAAKEREEEPTEPEVEIPEEPVEEISAEEEIEDEE